MSEPWPHAPPHSFEPGCTYMVTAGTVRKELIFSSHAKLDAVVDIILELTRSYIIRLQAWAVLANHYHAILCFQEVQPQVTLSTFLRHLHREIALRVNRIDAAPGRPVIYQFWDSRLTYEKSWLARLNYVNQNPVRHGVATLASDYPWCSARWFESNARPAFVKSVQGFQIDRVNVMDDF